MKIAYKGTNKSMKCRDTQFELGKTYYIDDQENVKELPQGYTIIKTEVKLCTKKALHYCNILEDVFKHYDDNGENRFFEIEVLGEFEDSWDKSGARCIKFLREISREELNAEKKKKEEEILDNRMKIDIVRALQEVNPYLVIGGSIALYLQGVRLKRFGFGSIDYDITMPFYQPLETKNGITIEQGEEDRPSGSDYGETVLIQGIKADIRIDPKQKYETIKYKDFNFKVVPLHIIIEAKARYASKKWGKKHLEDLKEMILNK